MALTKDDIKPGDVLVVEMFGIKLEVKVGKMNADNFITSFGPVPYSSLVIANKKAENE